CSAPERKSEMSIGLLLLRLVVGLSFVAHGTQKLWGWFGGGGLEATSQFFTMLGFPKGHRHAFMAGLAEAGGGLLLALGLLTPLGTLAIISVMLVATVTMHLPKGFFAQNGGYEYPLVMATSALALAFTGPGAYSLDWALGIYRSGTTWAVGALVLGLIGGAVSLSERRKAPEQAATTR
ncbi:MAG: DoxX family protein, partial [Terriglobales bacterium]